MNNDIEELLQEIHTELSRTSEALWEIARKDQFSWLGPVGVICGVIIGILLATVFRR